MAAKTTKNSGSAKISFGSKKVGRFSKKHSPNKRSKNYKKAYRGQGR